MNTNNSQNWALHAYADNQMSDAEKRALERDLATNEDAQKFLGDIRWQNAALRKAFDQALNEEVPHDLLKAAMYQPTSSAWPRWALAASLAAALIGGSIGWQVENTLTSVAVAQTLPQRALDAFAVYGSDVRHPIEVAATEKEHLQTWLSNRIGVRFTVPDLSEQGYSLLGGRLLAENGKPAGLLMYEDAKKKRLSIYVAANTAKNNSEMVVEQHGPLVTCYWVEPDMVYALAGGQTAEQMLVLAKAAHEGFDLQG